MFSVFLGRVLRVCGLVLSLVFWVWCCVRAACLGLRLTLPVLGLGWWFKFYVGV